MQGSGCFTVFNYSCTSISESDKSITADRGLIEKRNDPEDKRRTFLEISERGLREMTLFLTKLSSSREPDSARP
ncbi:winged helix DNA-binding protein [Novosphingobium fluoreni]|uniref:winged helix DNA-binding protein n=1 Tax=Novosphingobium fluoreni TaxID=1391222 RepID=UPI003CCCE4CC